MLSPISEMIPHLARPVTTDPPGVSGRAMLKAIIAGERDEENLAEMSRGLP